MNYDYCNGRIHTVKRGDTLYKISGMYHVPLALILRANPYVDIYNLQEGDKLCIPGGFDNETKPPKPQKPQRPQRPTKPNNPQVSGYVFVIKDAQSLQSILDRFGITLEELLKENTPGNIMIQPGTAVRIPGAASEKTMAETELDDYLPEME